MSAMKKPNIIYILADDMGYGDLSCLNEHSHIHTPHLDQMAAEGLTCTDAHSSSAVCTPSRYSILTGRYNWRSKLKEGVVFGYDGPVMEPGRITVARYLQERGYDTACIGKWHLGWDWATSGEGNEDIDFSQPIRHGPTCFGFDTFFGIIGSLDMDPYVYVENDVPTAVPDRTFPGATGKLMCRPGPQSPDFEHSDVLPNFTRRAVTHIQAKAQGENPFFLYLPLPAPHTPILPSPEFQGKTDIGSYGDFCLQVDDTVGQILSAVKEAGCEENTLVVFTSDNGFAPIAGFEELVGKGHNPSYHFRGHKADIYEGGHRIPYLVKWPETIAAGTESTETICLSDFLATLADLMESPLPDHAGEDSVSNLPIWKGEELDGPLREATVHSSVDGSFSIRKGVWKLEMCPGSGGWSWPQQGVTPEGFPALQLYRLDVDISEQVNLEGQYPEKVQELRDLLSRYIEQGRSTPGAPQENEGGTTWEQVWWTSRQQRTGKVR